MPRRIDLGRAVLFAGSALLFISLFLEWYDVSLTGWQVFESLDLVLAALAAAGIFMALRPDATAPWAAMAVPAAAVVVVFVQLVDTPPAARDASPSSGAWLALAGSLLMGAGSALSLAAISVTVQVRERDVRRRVAAVDRRHMTDEELEAEDLDPDADEPSSSTSLFGGGLGLPGEPVDEPDASARSRRRTRRFTPREQTASEPAHAVAGGSDADADEAPALGDAPPAGAGADADDLERTQPLTGLPDAEEGDAGRP